MTGLVVHNEAVLPSLADALRQRRKQIPKDLFGRRDRPRRHGGESHRRYTNIAIRAEELGKIAFDMLRQYLGGQDDHRNPAALTRAHRAVGHRAGGPVAAEQHTVATGWPPPARRHVRRRPTDVVTRS